MPLPFLPVDAILPDLREALAVEGACVVHAPPGSGKTTRIPLALLDAPWLGPHKILMLEPRRLAARAAARHMAGLLGEKTGERIGYRTRLDLRVSRQTRVEVVTEGILTRMLQHDPELSGYGCVIFDEFHARGLQGDLGLALCLDVRGALRPDLRLMVMSATLDVEAVAGLIAPCRVLSCPGQPHPVDTRYLRLPGTFVEERMAKAIRHLLTTEPDGILAFLPGAREIQRTHELLDNPGPGVSVHPLLGALTAAEQDQAIAPAAPGTRKVVLATAIAETSLTIEGVRIVIDSGLARLPRFDPVSGMTRLVTEPASLATLTQRRGRAGRTEPGVCIRIWDQADEISRKPFPLPEILEADLAPLVLDLALWGVTDPARLTWPTPPPTGNYSSAVQLLQRLRLVDEQGRVTAHGRDVAILPLHPRLGHMVLTAAKQGLGPTAVHLAALLAEPGQVMRAGPDLRDALSPGARIPEPVRQGMDQIRRLASIPSGPCAPDAAGALVALAYPDRVARRQEDGSYRLTSGRKAVWPGPNALAVEEFLAIAFALLRYVSSVFDPGMLNMVIGHITFQIAFVALVVGSRLAAISTKIEEAARDLYADNLFMLRHVTLPLLRPGIVAGAMLAFTMSLDDFVISFFTAGPSSMTLPLYIYAQVRRGVTPDIHALSTIVLLITILAVVIAERFSRTSTKEKNNA